MTNSKTMLDEDKKVDSEQKTIPHEVFEDAQDLLRAIARLSPGVWYRGHADVSWELKTSIAREKRPTIDLERKLRIEFENQTTFLDPASHPLGIGKCNFLMRHYGVPNRLLDWTTFPLAALYFSVCNEKEDGADGCIWHLNPGPLNRYYKKEYPHECDGEESHLYSAEFKEVLAIHAPYTNLRMKFQCSEFTIHGVYEALEDLPRISTYLEKWVIRKELKQELRGMLDALGIDRKFLFPDLDNISKTIIRDVLKN